VPTLSLLKSRFLAKKISIFLTVFSEMLSLSYFYSFSFNALWFSNAFLALPKYSSSLPYYPFAILGSIIIYKAINVYLTALTGFKRFFNSTKWDVYKPFNSFSAASKSGSAIDNLSLHSTAMFSATPAFSAVISSSLLTISFYLSASSASTSIIFIISSVF
jgi:hypothetical protein